MASDWLVNITQKQRLAFGVLRKEITRLRVARVRV